MNKSGHQDKWSRSHIVAGATLNTELQQAHLSKFARRIINKCQERVNKSEHQMERGRLPTVARANSNPQPHLALFSKLNLGHSRRSIKKSQGRMNKYQYQDKLCRSHTVAGAKAHFSQISPLGPQPAHYENISGEAR